MVLIGQIAMGEPWRDGGWYTQEGRNFVDDELQAAKDEAHANEKHAIDLIHNALYRGVFFIKPD